MKKCTRLTFSPEFRLDVSPLVVDQNYTDIVAGKTMNVGTSTMAKWAAQLKHTASSLACVGITISMSIVERNRFAEGPPSGTCQREVRGK